MISEGRVLLLCEVADDDVEVCESRLTVYALFEEGNDEETDKGVPQ